MHANAPLREPSFRKMMVLVEASALPRQTSEAIAHRFVASRKKCIVAHKMLLSGRSSTERSSLYTVPRCAREYAAETLVDRRDATASMGTYAAGG